MLKLNYWTYSKCVKLLTRYRSAAQSTKYHSGDHGILPLNEAYILNQKDNFSAIQHRGLTMASGNSETLNKKRIGIIQMTSVGDKNANFIQAKSLIQRARILGAQMVFLPECFDYVGENSKVAVAEAEDVSGETIQEYRALARDQGLWLSLGGFHEKASTGHGGEAKGLNTHLIIDKDGEIKGRYSKVHLFDVDISGSVRLKESDYILPGDNIGPPVETPVGKIGMGICYDLRFPEMSIALTQQGADILTYPSAFTVPTGKAHWETLLKCRAIENQCYVVAAAQVGRHNDKRESYGHAMIVDPWGEILAECPDKPDILVADIDLEYLHKRRQQMPVCQHRRHDLYGTISLNNKEYSNDIAVLEIGEKCRPHQWIVHIDSQPIYQFGQKQVLCSQVFYRTALSIAFVNKKPVLPGLNYETDVLISPVRPVERFCDMSSAEVADLFQTVQRVSGVIKQHHNSPALTVAVQDGIEAGQTIRHVHVHILPRKGGDFQNSDDVYSHLESHDKNVAASQWRTDEDMSAEATTLRPYFS